MSSRKSQLMVVAAGLAVALAVIVTRLLVDARSACREAAAAEQNGDATLAIRRYLDAGRLYVPGSPYTRTALDRLDAIAVASVNKGDYATARSAFEAERAAMLGTRSFYTPYASRLPELEQRLARLMAAAEENSGDATVFEEHARWHLERFAEHPRPKNSMVALALLGLALWIGSAVVFFLKGVSASLAIQRVPAIFSSAGFLLGLALFLAGLRLA